MKFCMTLMLIALLQACASNMEVPTKTLNKKTVSEIMEINEITDDGLLFSSEPPCVLYEISFKLDNSYLVMVLDNIEYSKRFSKTCSWDKSIYLNVIPNKIYYEKMTKN